MNIKPLLAGAATGFALGFAMVPTSAIAASGLLDGSFETQGAANLGGANFCFFNPITFPCSTTSPWSGTGAVAGVSFAGSGNPLPPTPDGIYHGYLSSQGTLLQTFVAQQSGDFRLNWIDSGWPNLQFIKAGTLPYVVELISGGSTLQLYSGTTTDAQPWIAREATTLASLISGQSYTLQFRSLATTDQNAGFDAVRFTLVGGGGGAGVIPEPATWAMMIAGFGLVGGMMRRRRQTTVLS